MIFSGPIAKAAGIFDLEPTYHDKIPLGALSWLAIGKQATFIGTADSYERLLFLSESITKEIEQVMESGITDIPDESKQYAGLDTNRGEIAALVYPDTIGHLLRAAFGPPVTTGPDVNGQYTHVFVPMQNKYLDDCDVPPYSIHIHRDLQQAWRYTGCVVDKLEFRFGIEQKVLRATASVMARESAFTFCLAPAISAKQPFKWHQAAVKLDGIAYEMLSDINFNIANSLGGEEVLGSDKIVAVHRDGFRVCEAGLTIAMPSIDHYLWFKNQAAKGLTIEFVSVLDRLKFEILVMRLTSFPLGVTSTGRVTVTVNAKGKYHPDAGAMRVTLVNDKVTY